MSPAKPVRERIGEPRKDRNTGRKRAGRREAGGLNEAADFTVARRLPATRAAGSIDFARAAYALSVHDPRELPPEGAPEIAFAGRSNAGKSSAINALARQRRLAFVSKTPGRTQLINFFSLGGAYLVDLPGYGYAGVPPAVRRHWEHLVGTYVAERGSLAAVVVVMDARHPLTPLDLQLLEWLRAASRPVHVLLTKADKLSRQAGLATLAAVRARLAEASPGATAQLFSSLRAHGVTEAVEKIAMLAAKNKAPAKGE